MKEKCTWCGDDTTNYYLIRKVEDGEMAPKYRNVMCDACAQYGKHAF